MGKVLVPTEQLTDAEIDGIVADLERKAAAARTARGVRGFLEHAAELRQFKRVTRMSGGRRLATDEAPEGLRRFLAERAASATPEPRGGSELNDSAPPRCTDAGCIRLVWRDSLCWWCWQLRHQGNDHREAVHD